MTLSNHNFLGLPEEYSSYKTSKAAVLPVPYEATVSFGKGTAGGPAAIIEASNQVEFYDEELERESYNIGIATMPAVPVLGVKPSRLPDHIASHVRRLYTDEKLPIILGGEHSITPAVIREVIKHHRDITVVQFDAHADLRQEYEGEAMSHACAMARVREYCPVTHVGIRNISKEEAVWSAKENFPIFYAHKMRKLKNWMNDVLVSVKTDKIYITIDVDAFDSSLMPATGTPEPGGLFWDETINVLKLLITNKKVVGMDFVELAPIKDFHACDFLVAKLIYKCIGYWSTSCNR